MQNMLLNLYDKSPRVPVSCQYLFNFIYDALQHVLRSSITNSEARVDFILQNCTQTQSHKAHIWIAKNVALVFCYMEVW